MIDLALFAFVMAFLALGIARPFLWVLAYIYIDILAPQKIGWTRTPPLPLPLNAGQIWIRLPKNSSLATNSSMVTGIRFN